MVVLLTTASLEGQHLAKSFFNTGLLGAAGSSAPSDDQFNRVSFLSHFEGSNNGVNNAFDDGSANNYTVTAAGNVTQGSFGPFARLDGEWGVDFEDGDSLAVASSSDFDFGTSNFTWECFVFQKSRSAFQLIMAQDDYSSGNSISCWLTDTGQASIYYEGGGTHFTTTATVPLNTWTHLAWVRKGTGTNEFSIYINGTAEVSGTMTTSFDQDGIIIGQQANGSYDFIGNISNIRIVNGSAVYTGNFTTPTSKLTAVTNTKLLTCQSNRFVDNSASGHTVTPSGNAAVSAFGPFLTNAVYDPAVNGASAYMDGSGDTLRATWTAADIINQNFTLEYWLYYTQTSGYGSVSIGANDNSASYTSLTYLASNGQVFSDDGQNSGSGPATSAGAISPNSWNHLALVRVSNDMFIYINGAKIATKAITASLFQGQSAEFGIGYIANPLEGYICDARIVTSAVYTGDTYTVPTAPLTAITNTKLLLNMADGQAIDSAAQNNLTLYGTAKTSTAQKKFGTASLLLDGNSDFAYLHNRNNLSGPFCIEAWGWADNLPSGGCTLWCLGTYKIQLQVTNDTVRIYRVGTAEEYTNFFTGGEFSVDTWHHVALVRDTSNVIKCYLNGTASGTTVTDATAFLATSGIFIIGAEADGDPVNQNVLDPWDGYIDDFRISNFARYTSNFTAPTKAFADKGQ